MNRLKTQPSPSTPLPRNTLFKAVLLLCGLLVLCTATAYATLRSLQINQIETTQTEIAAIYATATSKAAAAAPPTPTSIPISNAPINHILTAQRTLIIGRADTTELWHIRQNRLTKLADWPTADFDNLQIEPTNSGTIITFPDQETGRLQTWAVSSLTPISAQPITSATHYFAQTYTPTLFPQRKLSYEPQTKRLRFATQSQTEILTTQPLDWSPNNSIIVGNILLFKTADNALWRTTGFGFPDETAELIRIRETADESLISIPDHFTPFQDQAIFTTARTDAPIYNLWITNGQFAATQPLTTFAADTSLAMITPNQPALWVTDSAIYFFTSHTNPEAPATWDGRLWVSDGTAAATQPIYQFPSTEPNTQLLPQTALIEDTLYFILENEEGLPQLWQSNGTADSTYPLVTFQRQNGTILHPTQLTAVADALYFTSQQENGSAALWTFDPENGVKLVYETVVYNWQNISNLTPIDKTLYFSAEMAERGTLFWSHNSDAKTVTLFELDKVRQNTLSGLTVPITPPQTTSDSPFPTLPPLPNP